MNQEEKEHLMQILYSQENLTTALGKQNWYTYGEAVFDIVAAVEKWQEECVYGSKCRVCGHKPSLI